MKYLGLVLDGRFEEHFKHLAPKLLAAAGALGRILPNLDGPGGACRRLYMSGQGGKRTGLPLKKSKSGEKHEKCSSSVWRSRELAGNQKEAAAVRPVLKEWVERKYGAPSFHLTQLLTGHGCFGWYLCERVGREPTTACHHCDRRAVDTAQHTREECPAWDEPRAALFTVIGGDLSLPALICHMLSSEEEWEAVTTFSVIVMTQKEAAEKVRELSAAEGQAGGEESSQRD
ncbi:uncharacterized protein LOC125229363 [Leguminivora glycinivorella]|uniref:uncharacterized protein LOC125229363 n=1 Tax=Leguminivora glycinivorella TaxID=1035111 RepID=UPI00200C4693|nr:uncharacterized protein LOC125229363 [Leguminivora glycinivorella]